MKSALSISEYGHRFVVEPSSTSLSDDERKQIAELQPFGVMFRKRNFLSNASYKDWLSAYRELWAEIRSLLRNPHPLICIDHEGGRVIRPPEPITRFPYAACWAHRSAEVAHAMALELRSLGINCIFGPVVDIHSNPDNPVINQRAFGRTVDEVLQGAVPFVRACEAAGLLTCAKHFPGHGDTKSDSHFTLPVVDKNLDELRRVELVPFQEMIRIGIPMVMTAHILYPQLDPGRPATLSTFFLEDLLRGQLGFDGVVVADGLGMKAISSSLGDAEAITDGLRAGLDLFLMVGDNLSIADALTLAEQMHASSRSVPKELLARSGARIEKLRSRCAVYPVIELSQEELSQHAALAAELASGTPWGCFNLHLPGFE